MVYALDRFVAEVQQALAATGKVPADLVEVQTPKGNIPADLAFPAFKAAKAQGTNPAQLAVAVAEAIAIPDGSLIGAVSVAGPYVNFTLHPERFAAAVLADVLSTADGFGTQTLGAEQSIVVDYSAPNIAKRMHVGHIRSTIIGQAIVNIYRALGYKVIGDNHLGDWGTQFGMIIASIMRFGRPEGEGEIAMAELERIYSRYATEAKTAKEAGDATLEDEARRWSLALEQGDEQAREIWRWCVDLTLRAAERNYDRLGVKFDHAYGESFYEQMLPGVIEEALAKQAAFRDEGGAVVVDELGPKLPTFLLQRSDGGTLYMTRDLATIKFRVATFSPARIIYVVGAPQELHFRQLFALAKAVGYGTSDFVHVSFGTVFDQDGVPLSTRKGNMVYLESLLDEGIARARAVVDEKSPELSTEEKQAVAEAVGVGAVVYNDLYQDPKRNITLNWDSMLAINGNSATYLQYSHARCCSILRRAADAGAPFDPSAVGAVSHLLTHASEERLIRHIARLPDALREAAERFAPFVIADWCYTTAREFGVFFEQCPVLKAETPELRTARLGLVAATAQALKNGLTLLSIRAPERM